MSLDEPTLQTWVHIYTLLMVVGLVVGAWVI